MIWYVTVFLITKTHSFFVIDSQCKEVFSSRGNTPQDRKASETNILYVKPFILPFVPKQLKWSRVPNNMNSNMFLEIPAFHVLPHQVVSSTFLLS